MTRRLLAALSLLLLVPAASAAVVVEEVEVPERTAATKPFEVRVRLSNDGGERSVHLFGALYTYEEGQAPCGPTTDPSFRTFTHIVQETIELPANGEVMHPPEGGRWLHRYDVEDAGVEPSLEELCVFVAAATGGPVIQYEAYGVERLSVRARNTAPQASFTVDPTSPAVSQQARFTAEATDAEGDPVAFTWDFGRFDANGRATAEGDVATHAFYPEGSYTVTLTASDGIDSVPLARTLTVVPLGAQTEDERARTPLPVALLLVALLVTARLRRS